MNSSSVLSAVANLLNALSVDESSGEDFIICPKSVVTLGGQVNSSFEHTISGNALSSPLNTGDVVPSDLPKYATGDSSDSKGNNNIEQIYGRFTNGTIGDLLYELGGDFNLTQLILFNYSEVYQGNSYNNRGLISFNIEFSLDGKVFFNSLSIYPTLISEPAPDEVEAQVFDFAGLPIKASHIKLTNLKSEDTTFTGFGQIRFVGKKAN